jgi:hypothetical protein
MFNFWIMMLVMVAIILGIELVAYMIGGGKHPSELNFGSKPWWDSVDKDKDD